MVGEYVRTKRREKQSRGEVEAAGWAGGAAVVGLAGFAGGAGF
jgi:hypothetical protein